MEEGYRHEYKHFINAADAAALRMRLRAALSPDPNAGADGEYEITSLYFDTPWDTALREKQDGVPRREKFRLRRYNGDLDSIKLEKKSKLDGLCRKASAVLTRQETAALLSGSIDWMRCDPRPLVRELHAKMRTALLAPKTLVVYRRAPFICPAGNVRITLDWDLRTGGFFHGFLDPDAPLFPAAPGILLLEVKYDAFLPDFVRGLVAVPDRRASGFSKYAACRCFEQ